jgi:hypothetical protein
MPIVFISCQKEFNVPETSANATISNSEVVNTFYGREVQMGNGKIRSWITIDKANVPVALGVEMTSKVLLNLPMDEESLGSIVLPLHHKAKELTPFDHITVDWHPFGHEPAGIYDVAHFDFHFYKISLEEQNAIPPYEIDPTGFDALPEPDFIPPLYFRGPGGVAQMGAHWVDVLSPEFNGGQFTSTFLIGTYGGEVIFYEPMITKNTIESGVTLDYDIRQPLRFSPSGVYYPTHFSMYVDTNKGKHYVAMEGFVKR